MGLFTVLRNTAFALSYRDNVYTRPVTKLTATFRMLCIARYILVYGKYLKKSMRKM